MAFGENLIVRTKLIRPRLKPRFLARPRITQLLNQACHYPLTIVKADPGYGKSSALAAFLAESRYPHFWYSLTETDADPLLFLLHLIYVFRTVHPTCGEQALALLQSEGGAAQLWAPAIDTLVNDLLAELHEESFLVLDDYHSVDRLEISGIIDRFIERMPPRLHVILATRVTPNLPSRIHWRVHGELLEITQAHLAFTPAEVTALFAEHYHHPLSPAQADVLAAETEGWIIALQMVGEQLQASATSGLNQILYALPGSLELLFDYLASEVLAKQPPAIQAFLLNTAILRRLEPEVCNRLLDREDSASILRYLDEHSLFVIGLGGGAYRYHHLFQDFLARRAQVDSAAWHDLHRRAAHIYRAQGDSEEAVHHFLAAGENDAAVDLLNEIGYSMVKAGRWETLASWIDRLPPDRVQACGDLLFYRGEAHRLSSHFEEALAFYQDSRQRAAADQDLERELRALYGQVMVYLDTVQPARAKPILEEARRLARSQPQSKAALLALVAENLTNEGRLKQAERLHRAVYHRCPNLGIPAMDPRIYVRQGRLAEAHAMVQQDLRTDPWGSGQKRMPRSHRESTALLAWICAMMGEEQAARAYAERGLRLGRELHSPIVETVSLARLGHAYLTGPDYDVARALNAYHESLRLAETIHVPRFGAEAYLGLTVAFGLQGQLAESQKHARAGIAILEAAGDAYLTSVIWLALGGAAVIAKDEHAEEWLSRAAALGRACGDAYGPCLAQIWRALWHLERREWALFDPAAHYALQQARLHQYDFLYTRQTFLGPKEPYGLAALLTAANRRGLEPGYAAVLLQELAARLPSLALSVPSWPPSQSNSATSEALLYVQTLGPFRVWRGGREISRADWGRGKALQLFQLLLSRRGRPLHREQIAEMLWPEAKASAAAASLRVTLNALRRTLEPGRAPEAESQFVQRHGDTLRLNPEANLRVDADEFERVIEQARQVEARDPMQALRLYRHALVYYQGDYLQDALYEDWASEERERLMDLYLTTASHVAELLVEQGAYEEAIQLCHQILAKDSCWEEAYYLLMLCHSQQGNRSLALRTYERCVKHLHTELGVTPSSQTAALFRQISQS